MEPHADLIRAFLADRDEPCPRCGYNLRNATSAICPECGDTARLSLVRTRIPRIAILLAAIVLVGRFLTSGWEAVYRALYLTDPPGPWRWWYVEGLTWAVLVSVWAIASLVVSARHRRRGHSAAAGRTLVIAALALMAIETARPIWLFLAGYFLGG